MNNTMVREICGEKWTQNHPLKIKVRKIGGGGNYASKYGISYGYPEIWYAFYYGTKMATVLNFQKACLKKPSSLLSVLFSMDC
jgi:hypothetical protein